MFHVRFDAAPLRAKAQDLRLLPTHVDEVVHEALLNVTHDEVEQEIIPATPRSALVQTASGVHVHMQDRWTVTDHGDSVSIDNLAPYGGFVAKYPDHFGARVEAHHNRRLHAAIEALPEHLEARMRDALPEMLARL